MSNNWWGSIWFYETFCVDSAVEIAWVTILKTPLDCLVYLWKSDKIVLFDDNNGLMRGFPAIDDISSSWLEPFPPSLLKTSIVLLLPLIYRFPPRMLLKSSSDIVYWTIGWGISDVCRVCFLEIVVLELFSSLSLFPILELLSVLSL